nr:hypothetical protein [Propionibacterium sp.]
MALHWDVVAAADLTTADIDAMFALMDLVYDGMRREAFEADLAGKDEAIVLRTDAGRLVGFSTQRALSVRVGEARAAGVFSGDTVIHPEHWGSPALLQAFARRYIVEREEPFWWFLVSKGHRTYRFLSTFFTTFWPDRRSPTPPAARAVMDAYATALFPDDYDAERGVLAYRTPKDRLRPGIAGVGARDLTNPDVAFFVARNPGHALGHDLVCLCDLAPANLKPRMRPILLGQPCA